MIFIKNIKIFVISVMSLAVYVQARSISQIGDILVERADDYWKCDMIKCPQDTHRCYVSKTNEEPSVLKRINICYSSDNQILAEKVTTSATDPNNRISQHVNSYRNGGISTVSGSTNNDFDEKQFQENLNRDLEKFRENLHSQLSGVNEGLKHLHGNLNKMHQDIDANLEHEMQNLKENLNTMHYNLAHMFD